MNKCHQQHVNPSWICKLVNRGRLGFAFLKACTLSTVAEDRTSENQSLFSPLFYLYWQHIPKKEAFSRKTQVWRIFAWLECIALLQRWAARVWAGGRQDLQWSPILSCVSCLPRTVSTLPILSFSEVLVLTQDSKLRASIRE